MVWIYQRDQHRIEFAIRREQGTDAFALTCRFPGGRTTTDLFVTREGFYEYVDALETALTADGWDLIDAPRRPVRVH